MEHLALERAVAAVGRELRDAMWTRRTVRLTLTDRCDGVRVTLDGARILEGTVTSVSPTDAFCMCAGRHIPLSEILVVKRPHYTDTPASDPREPDADGPATIRSHRERE